MTEAKYGDVTVTMNGNVAQVEIHRPPAQTFSTLHSLRIW